MVAIKRSTFLKSRKFLAAILAALMVSSAFAGLNAKAVANGSLVGPLPPSLGMSQASAQVFSGEPSELENTPLGNSNAAVKVNVINGSYTGDPQQSGTINLTANEVAGMRFWKWSVANYETNKGITIAGTTASQTTATLGSAATEVTVTAEYDSISRNQINAGFGGINSPEADGTLTAWEGDKVNLGKDLNGNPIAWNVLNPAASSEGDAGYAFLISDNKLGSDIAFKTDESSNAWDGSDLQEHLNAAGTGLFYTVFPNAAEQAAVANNSAQDIGIKTYAYNSSTTVTSTTYDKLFAASIDEVRGGAENVIGQGFGYGFVNNNTRQSSGEWWLRSPGQYGGVVATVWGSGIVWDNGRIMRNALGVRPALNLNQQSIIFTSLAQYPSLRTDDFLTLTDTANQRNTWDLTVQDPNVTDFAATGSETVRQGGTMTVNVTNVSSLTGANQISALLMNEDGAAIAGGKISNSVATGDKTFTIPEDTPKGDYALRVFAVNAAASNGTQYASNVVTLDLTVEGKEYPVNVINGTSIIAPQEAGTTVNISAIAAPSNMEFDKWVTDSGGTFGSVEDPNTTFTTPNNEGTGREATITALYRVKGTPMQINLGFGGIESPDITATTEWTGSKVSLGQDGEGAPVLWNVLNPIASSEGTENHAFLTTNGLPFGTQKFADDSSAWASSHLRTYMNTTLYGGDTFTAADKAAIADDIPIKTYSYDRESYTTTNDKIFPLSVQEAAGGISTQAWGQGFGYGFVNDAVRVLTSGGGATAWWLRSPGSDVDRAADVVYNGNVHYFGDYRYNPRGVRPALNLNLESVIFTSLSGASRTENFHKLATAPTGDTWNLNLSDGDTSFAATTDKTEYAAGDEATVTVDTASAATTNYTQLSALLVDSNNTVVAGGKIGDSVTAGSTATFTLPENLGGNYVLKVFATDATNADGSASVSRVSDISLRVDPEAKDVTVAEKNMPIGTGPYSIAALDTKTLDPSSVGRIPTLGAVEKNDAAQAFEAEVGSTFNFAVDFDQGFLIGNITPQNAPTARKGIAYTLPLTYAANQANAPEGLVNLKLTFDVSDTSSYSFDIVKDAVASNVSFDFDIDAMTKPAATGDIAEVPGVNYTGLGTGKVNLTITPPALAVNETKIYTFQGTKGGVPATETVAFSYSGYTADPETFSLPKIISGTGAYAFDLDMTQFYDSVTGADWDIAPATGTLPTGFTVAKDTATNSTVKVTGTAPDIGAQLPADTNVTFTLTRPGRDPINFVLQFAFTNEHTGLTDNIFQDGGWSNHDVWGKIDREHVISVDVEWASMDAFTYEIDWNTTTHQWENKGWRQLADPENPETPVGDLGLNGVRITNHSSTAVNIAHTYQDVQTPEAGGAKLFGDTDIDYMTKNADGRATVDFTQPLSNDSTASANVRRCFIIVKSANVPARTGSESTDLTKLGMITFTATIPNP